MANRAAGIVVRGIGTPLLAFSAFTTVCSPTHADNARVNKLTYHYNAQRTGWTDQETVLRASTVGSSQFGLQRESLPLDYFDGLPPRLFASPLYVDSLDINAGQYRGQKLSAVFAVTTTGYAYAISTNNVRQVPGGTVIWRRRLTAKPCDGGATGNLSTPVIDLQRLRFYVTSCDVDSQWQAHALDIRSGDELPEWPVTIDHQALNNGTTQYGEKLEHRQRGSLNLSPDGARLYVSLGNGDASGWLVAVDTHTPKIATAFSTTPRTSEKQGGMWSSAGPSVDQNGDTANFTIANQCFAIADILKIEQPSGYESS